MKKNEKSDERLVWADVVRVAAIYLVLVVHASSMPPSAFPLSNSWLNIISFSIAKTCVPLFVMLSGALLLEKIEPYKIFFKKRFLRVLIPWVIWTFIYMGTNYFLKGTRSQTISEWKYDFTVTFLTELWFLPLIFSIYLLTPILRLIYSSIKKVDKIYIMIVWFVSVCILPFINPSLAFPKPFNSGLLSLAVYFSGYFFLGSILKKINYPKNTVLYTMGLIILGIATNFISLFVVNRNDLLQYQSSVFDYLAPGVVITSIGIYVLIYYLFTNKFKTIQSNLLVALSSASLGIYIVHGLLRQIIIPFLNHNLGFDFKVIPILGSYIEALFIFIIAFAVVFGLKKIPVIKYIVP